MSDDKRYIQAIRAGCFWAERDSPTRLRNVDIETRERTVRTWLGLEHHQWNELTEDERADRILARIDNERSLAKGTPQLLVDDLISMVVSNGSTMSRSEIDEFYSLDDELWTLVLGQDRQELLPSRDIISRQLDHLKHGDGSQMRPVQFEGKCNLPGDWSEGEYYVVPNRWLREMFALRSALTVPSSVSESPRENTTKANECNAQSTQKDAKENAGPKLSLDDRAVALFVSRPNLTQKQMAEILKCHTKSLTPKRCPKLKKANQIFKAKGHLPSGSKGRDGTIEAEDHR